MNSFRFKFSLPTNFDDSFHLDILKEALLRAIHDIDATFSKASCIIEFDAFLLVCTTVLACIISLIFFLLIFFHAIVMKEASKNNLDSGSTATVALMADGQILAANIGDSKALLCSEKFQSPAEAKGLKPRQPKIKS
jgi:serine/threonine protein phosphatase PrpC